MFSYIFWVHWRNSKFSISLACAKFDFIFDKSGALHEIEWWVLVLHLDNFYLKCVILSKGGLWVFFGGNNMGEFFCCLGLVFIKKIFWLKIWLKVKCFEKDFTQEKGKKVLEVAISISLRYSNIPRDLCSFQFMWWTYFKSRFLDSVKISSF
jgi:hypothetical protein